MKVNLKDLEPIEMKKVKMILKSGGLTAKRVNLYKDGNMLVVEIKETGETFQFNLA